MEPLIGQNVEVEGNVWCRKVQAGFFMTAVQNPSGATNANNNEAAVNGGILFQNNHLLYHAKEGIRLMNIPKVTLKTS